MNKTIIPTIKKERKMLNFQRLAGTRKIRSYNLAEHSYFVGLMFQELAEELGIKISVEVLGTVFRHDFMEVFTTDLPWQVKHISQDTEKAWDTIEKTQGLGRFRRKPYVIFNFLFFLPKDYGILHKLKWVFLPKH